MKKDTDLSRTMGFWGISSLGVGAIIGAGVFVLTGLAAGEAGPALILAFILNGVLAIIIGGCYAELSAMMPRAGGAYIWVRAFCGDTLGFFAGWFSWFAQVIACSFYATAFGSFLIALLNSVGIATQFGGAGIAQTASAIFISLIFLGTNLKGSGNTSLAQLIITSIQVLIIVIFLSFGIGALIETPAKSIENLSPFFPEGISGLLAAMGLSFIAFEGFEIIVQSGEEVRKPRKNIPKSILLSIILSTVIYALVAAVMLGGIEVDGDLPIYKYLGNLGELGLVTAAGQMMPYGKIALLLAALASTASALNATIYGSTRVVLAMGRNSDMPNFLSKISTSTRTPVYSILTTGVIILAITILLPIKDIAASTDIMFILVFMSVAASLLVARRSDPDRERPFRLPLSPYLPGIVILIGVTLCISLSHLSRAAWMVAVGWTLIGILILLFNAKKADKTA